MRHLRRMLGHAPAPSESLPMGRKEIAFLLESDIITIGGHTRTHPALGTLEPDDQRDEIESGRLDCQTISRTDVPGFAYPYGNFGPNTAALVRDAGFQWACSTESLAVNRADFRLFSLPRLQVRDWSAEQLGFALKRIAK
jgi:peptidoglycan/xylan/chitin deacetylase (PgdA/CDA1 family)